MARKTRFNLPDIPHHVIQRGNNRETTFFNDEDCQFYLLCLREAADKYRCEVHAYVLMPNHVHLLVTPRTPDGVSRLMQSLGRRYVQHVNYKYQRSGTLWEGRYRSSLVEAERHLLSCYRYIELNPVRAGLVESPADYPWSSHAYHAFGGNNSVIVDHPVYMALGTTVQTRRTAYQKLFQNDLDDMLVDAIRVSGNRGGVLGSQCFMEEVQAHLPYRLEPGKPGRPRKATN